MNDEKGIHQVLLILMASFVFSSISCQTMITEQGTLYESRNWDVNYDEIVQINTEPPGCRIYIQGELIGVSPIKHRLSCGKINVVQSGEYPAKYRTQDQAKDQGTAIKGISVVFNEERLGQTTWKLPIHPLLQNDGEATIVAAAEGYEAETRLVKINNQNQALRNAVAELRVVDGGKLSADSVEGKSSILIVLKPKGTSGTAYQSPMGQSDGGRAAAQAEYDSAFQAYNTALQKLNEARAGQDATRMTAPINMGSGTPMGTLLGVTAPLASNQLLRDAEREVEVARQRLETAKAQLSRY